MIDRAADIFIIGAGAAGLAAAEGAIRAGASSVMIADGGPRVGGILPQCLHVGFGLMRYGEEMNGPAFLTRMLTELPENIHILLNTTVLSVSPDRTALLSSEQGLQRVRFRQLIPATGASEIDLRSLGIAGTRPAGIFTAGLAQQLVNLDSAKLGEKILILGSGDVGLVMAGRFAELGKKPLAIIEKMPHLGGLMRNQQRYAAANRIPLRLSSAVTEIHGAGRIQGVTVRRLTDGKEEYLPCDTLITALGMVPDRRLFAGLAADGALPDWVHPAGNCDFIHDIVDRVLSSGSEIGRQAALALADRAQ